MNVTAIENSHEVLSVRRRLDQKTKQLSRSSRTHCFFPNAIKPLQPLDTIVGRMLQQQKGRSRHVVCDVAQAPLAATPNWPKVHRLLLRIVTFTRREFVELQRHWRRDLR